MNKKISIGITFALLFLVAALVFSITMNYATSTFNTRVSDLRDREVMYEKYAEIDRIVRFNFNGAISETQLMDSVAEGYVGGIGDKYGRYYSAEEYKKMVSGGEGENVGIGVVVETAPDDFYLVVTEVYPDSPAEVAGILAGDLIVQIDDTELSRENSAQMMNSIQGPVGSKITVVTRRGSTESAPLDMIRRDVAVPTVLYSQVLSDSTIGYLYIKEFSDRTYDQFNRELLRLIDNGVSALIIDVRDNSSDTLRSTTRVLDRLLPAGVLVSAVYKDGSSEVLYTSDANEIHLPIVVLTNAGTTGAAELFAQNIKDFGRGSSVGTTTAGKGVMQEIIKLSDGSALQLSVATYQSASGSVWNGVGVKPDFEVAMEGDWTGLVGIEGADAQLVKAKEVATGMQNLSAAEASSEEEAESVSEPESASESQTSTESVSQSQSESEEESELEDSSEDSSEEEAEDESSSQT